MIFDTLQALCAITDIDYMIQSIVTQVPFEMPTETTGVAACCGRWDLLTPKCKCVRLSSTHIRTHFHKLNLPIFPQLSSGLPACNREEHKERAAHVAALCPAGAAEVVAEVVEAVGEAAEERLDLWRAMTMAK